MNSPVDAETNKAIYQHLHDEILTKRFHSPSPIRRHAHKSQYQAYVDLIPSGSTVLDSGCGEGVLSVILAKHGCRVLGVDLSVPNIEAAKAYAKKEGVFDKISFAVGDAEHLPAGDGSYDYVVCSHVLEHVRDFVKASAELGRVARVQVIAAIPTCLNPCSMVLLGGDKYWRISRRTPYAFFWGLLQVIGALITGKEGVNEGYEGDKRLIHIWRFPWKGKQLLEQGGLTVTSYHGSSYIFPYISVLLPLSRLLLKMKWWPIIRNFGYGTTYVCEPVHPA